MTTRGFDADKKAKIALRIREMDEKIDAAKAAIEADNDKRARELLVEFEEIKRSQLITTFPDIAMQERRYDIPFEILYDMVERLRHTIFDFLRWLGKELRKPRAKRDLSARRNFLIRLRRLLTELSYLTQLPWPPNDPARPILDDVIAKLRAIIFRMNGLTNDNARHVYIDEIDSVAFFRKLSEFLEKLGDPNFAISTVISSLVEMDNAARRMREKLLAKPDPHETPDERLFRLNSGLAMMETYKHRVGEVVEGAATVPAPAGNGGNNNQSGDGNGNDDNADDDDHGSLLEPDWQEQESAFAAAALDWTRRAFFEGNDATTMCELSRALDISEEELTHEFGTDTDLLVQALAPNGIAPVSVYPLTDDEEPIVSTAPKLTCEQRDYHRRMRAFLKANVLEELTQVSDGQDAVNRGTPPPDTSQLSDGSDTNRKGE